LAWRYSFRLCATEPEFFERNEEQRQIGSLGTGLRVEQLKRAFY
jgi:hypothetical protein